MRISVLHIAARLLIAALCAPVAADAGAAVATQPGHSCHQPGYDQALRCIDVAVPLDYQHADGARLALHVTLAPALREGARPDPVFVLAGGPGQAGSEILPLLDSSFRKLRATRDIVFIDQRGTGLSGKLDCESTQEVDDLDEAGQEQLIRKCMKSLDKPFKFYNTENSARDLEQVRNALGYSQVNLWGGSYGTRLGQAYARMFPASVRALVLDGVASPDQIIFAWGRDAQASLDTTFSYCATAPGCHAAYPNLPQQFSALLARVNGGEVKLDFYHPRTARRVQMQMAPARFLQTVRTALYSADSANRLPFLIDSADKGNWNPFVAQMYSVSDFSLEGPAIGLMLSVTCAEDIARVTPAIIADEEHNSFLAGRELKLMSRLCQSMDVPAIPYSEPAMISAPTLLLSGALDPVTPPYRAQSAAKLMNHAQQFVVTNASHIVSQAGCAPRLLREFIDHPDQPLAAECLKDIPRNSFQLGAAGPHP
ncbi:MAG TPA: alpha/beta fold hydrolase [Burkholderiaceae bacterium]